MTAEAPDRATRAFVERSGLVPPGAAARFERLPGGVSSDIWLVRAGAAAFCVKRALPRLRVAQLWQAPVARNAKEAAWLCVVGRFLPEAVPAVLAADAAAGMFAMPYLPPETHRNWKAQLAAGDVAPGAAALVGERLAHIHRELARVPGMAEEFATDETFHAIRLEPYLLATARAHPDRAATLEELAAATARTRRTVVHGDVSPKNILIGPQGPVFIDAECAWFGDPAFDLAFCLNHLLLKCLRAPAAAPRLIAAFAALSEAYLAGVDWEPRAALEARAARLLPGLFLARVDGKSPVEYLTREDDKDRVRRTARAWLARPVDRLARLRAEWAAQTAASGVEKAPLI